MRDAVPPRIGPVLPTGKVAQLVRQILFVALISGLVLGWGSSLSPVFAQPTPPPKTSPRPTPARDARGFLPVGPEGTVRFHPQKKIIEAKGSFNLAGGFLEFLACAPGIKPHETLIGLECNPLDLKFGLILLGLDEDKARRPTTDTDLRFVEGDRVVILLRWKTVDEAGQETVHEKRVEDCLSNDLVGEPMQRVGFVYTGSLFIEENAAPPADGDPSVQSGGQGDGKEHRPRMAFAPLLTGQYISVCHRPLAILDHPLEIPFPDASYHANPDVLPPVDLDAPVEVTLVIRRPLEGEIDLEIRKMKLPPRSAEDDSGSSGQDGDKDPPKKDGDGDGRTALRDSEDS